ncbi:MAG: endolytic transglycosylase MltG [Streptosporangiales bacterium]|nr:endolytic transglycosylase MltG [Streptosporangiales bacterium]
MNNLDLGFSSEEEVRPHSRRLARRRRKERRRRRRARIAATVAFLVVVVILGGTVWGGYQVYQKLTVVPDYKGRGTGRVMVQVQEQESLGSVGMKLEKRGVVKSAKAFEEAANENPDSYKVQPGHYQLRKRMAAKLALNRLLDPSAKVQWQITIPEGMRASKVGELLAKKTDIPLSKFHAAAKQPDKLGLPPSANDKIEGYLFPATYLFPPNATATSILRTMVQRYKQEELNLELKEQAKKRGLTIHQVVTLASLLEAEGKEKDFGKVSRVVYNRVDEGMKLQFDSTVTYALGRNHLKVTYEDLKVKSPYNTYKYKGLPPGPIDSPGKAALKAALNPTPGNWLYFVTTNPKTGETKFTDDPQEFQRFKNEYKRNS